MTGLAAGGRAEGRPVTGLAAQVTAALERSVRPSVIARGAAVRVIAADDGVVTLEVTGSPGAVFPLAARIEAAIRAAVPDVTGVRLVTPTPALPDTGGTPAVGPADAGGTSAAGPADAGGDPAPRSPAGPQGADGAPLGWTVAAPPDTGGTPAVGPAPAPGPPGVGDGLAATAQQILDAEVNTAIAAHRGHVTVTDATEGWVRIRLEGGCQGCSLAEVTLRQGIEPLLRARLPGMIGLIDVTDHEAGTEPFYSPAKR